MLTRRYQLLLLFAVIIAAYYPAVTADYSGIDDFRMIDDYRQANGWDLRGLFIPTIAGGSYYRPLIGLSFLIDRNLFIFNPGLMHLENILLHFLNVVLIYFLTLQLIPRERRSNSLLPLTAACLFGLHPVNAESVNWISGRTDILAGMFIFLSALFILKYRELHEKKYLTMALLSFLGGLLSKETALAFLPGAFLLVSAGQLADVASMPNKVQQNRRVRINQVIFILGGVVVVLVFYLLRSAAFTSNASRFGITLRAITNDLMYSMFIVLRAFGFYLKKLVFPYPLNLAILEADPLYEVLAIPLAALCVYIASRGTLLSAMFTTGVLLIAPAFVLAFGQIAWTPYAERYIYMTSAFFVIAAVVYLSDKVELPHILYVKATATIILVLMFASTLNRSFVWQTDTKLCEDTVKKSPMSRDIRAVYGTLLAKKGDYAAALIQLEKGRTISSLTYDERFDLTTAYIRHEQGRIDDAIKLSETALHRSGGLSIGALGYLIDLLNEKKQACGNHREKYSLAKKIMVYNLTLYNLNRDPHLLYKLGVGAAELGEKGKALEFFLQARGNLSANDPYYHYARTEIEKYIFPSDDNHAKNY